MRCNLIKVMTLTILILSYCCSFAENNKSIDIDSLVDKYNVSSTSISDVRKNRNDIYVFVSFSMPEKSIKQWMLEAREIGAPLLLQGLINNSFQETTKKIRTILPSDDGGMVLNPQAFLDFNIKQVPAVVVFNPSNPSDYSVVYGNGTLKTALENISEQKSDIAIRASEILKELEINQ